MAGDEEVEAIDADDETVSEEGEEVEGFGINIGSVGGFQPTVKGGGPKGPEGPSGPTGPTGPGTSTGKPSADFDPNTVHF